MKSVINKFNKFGIVRSRVCFPSFCNEENPHVIGTRMCIFRSVASNWDLVERDWRLCAIWLRGTGDFAPLGSRPTRAQGRGLEPRTLCSLQYHAGVDGFEPWTLQARTGWTQTTPPSSLRMNC